MRRLRTPAMPMKRPASLACLYGVTRPIPWCNPNKTKNTPNGGSQTIAIVDAYDDPNAAADLAFFSSQFGLPFSSSKFQVVYAGGSVPPQDPTGGWELEEALDIEYSHAMAPNAKLYLVEANSNYNSDLYAAVQVASNLVACGQTTTCPPHSKGQGRSLHELGWVKSSCRKLNSTPSSQLRAWSISPPRATIRVSSIPAPHPTWSAQEERPRRATRTPGISSRRSHGLKQEGESARLSPFPAIRPAIAPSPGSSAVIEGVPDISSDANPDTGLWVWDTFVYEGDEAGWFIVGGTSAASPTLAGIVNASGQFRSVKQRRALLAVWFPGASASSTTLSTARAVTTRARSPASGGTSALDLAVPA